MKYYYQINNLDKKISRFYDSNQNPISSEVIPETVKKVPMGFPLAVLFDPPLKGKIYAYVLDNAGRKQYFYTKDYKENMEEKKYKRYPKIIDRVEKLLNDAKNDNSEEALAVLLMSECNFRIGHEKYKKLYGTNGTLTLTASHMNKTDKGIEIEFSGKKKEINYCFIDKKSILYDKLHKIAEKSKTPLFKNLNYDKVYEFIKSYNIKPKDIRQDSANKNFYNLLKKYKYDGDTKRNTQKYLKEILIKTSIRMNHKPAVCKKEYLMPQWFHFDDANQIRNYAKKHDFKQTIKYISNI